MAQKITGYQFTRTFKKQYQSLPQQIQKTFDTKLSILLDNMLHRSLRVKRIQGTKGRWEGSISMKYRFTFELSENHVIFRTIGTHDILNK